MNVEKKVELMKVYESYWQMLPPEVQDYIRQLKISQEIIDKERKDLMYSLCHEIHLYGTLKANWGLGHINCKEVHCKCGAYSHLKISGYYVDENNVKKEMYLGHGFQQALSGINHVKSF